MPAGVGSGRGRAGASARRWVPGEHAPGQMQEMDAALGRLLIAPSRRGGVGPPQQTAAAWLTGSRAAHGGLQGGGVGREAGRWLTRRREAVLDRGIDGWRRRGV